MSEEQVGSVSDEAVKLFGALSDWARDQAPHAGSSGGPDTGESLAGLVDRAARAAHDVDEHLATGSPECTYCPICRAVHAVRRIDPEVRAHLTTAASSLLQAAAGLLASAVPAEERAPGRGPGVERIDLDTDDEHTARPEEDDE